MRFVSVRELRNRSARIWKELKREQDLIVTSNGKPVALLSAISEDSLEARMATLRRSRAAAAVEALQEASLRTGKSRITPEEIEAEIAAVRKARRR
jgi:prevent-host-death family protein